MISESPHHIKLYVSCLPLKVFSCLKSFYNFSLLIETNFHHLFILDEGLRFGTFHEENILMFCREGEDPMVPKLPSMFVFKIHIGVTVYLINSLL